MDEDDIIMDYQLENFTADSELMQTRLRTKFECISGKTWEEKLATCNNCKCCTRHMTNRPKKLEPWIEIQFSFDDSFGGCICPCRHNARFICRQVHEPISECPQGSPRDVKQFRDVLSPSERMAWLEHLDMQEMEESMEILTTSES
tara:strand:+ start:529 stop:966 length:438 start_codon:yes stop_codon:yes gene_type:complete